MAPVYGSGMSDPEYDPRELPRFDAFRDALTKNPTREAVVAWVDKLEAWARTTVGEVESLDKKLDDEREDFDTKMNLLQFERDEAKAAADEFETLQDRILDVERGIINFDELVGEVVRS